MMELVLESCSAFLIATIIYVLAKNLRRTALASQFGTKLILIGFCLLFFGAALDISDEYPQLSYLIILGDTPIQSFVEKFFGRFLGVLFILLGILRIMPVFSTLEEKHQLIETMVETIPAPTFCKDANGVYLACNQSFEEFLGLPRQQILNRTVYDIAPEELAAVYDRADRELLAAGERQIYEAQVEAADGTRRDVLFHKAVYQLDNGAPGGIVGVILDISDRKAVEEGLLRLDRMKSEFIGTAAHELRTPLTSIQGYSELLHAQQTGSREFSDEQCADFLHEIIQASESLSILIDDLLDIGRIESGAVLPMKIAPGQPENLLRRVIEAFRLRNPAQKILLHYAPGPSVFVQYDAQRFRQVMENLLSNAVKYSPDNGPIEVRAQIRGEWFVVQVVDNGFGMTAEQQQRIYEKFYRAEPTKDLVSGLGIGMSITRSIVEAHGGRIRIDSTPGKGTLVEIELPLAG